MSDTHGGHEIAEVLDARRTNGSAGCVGRKEKEWMRCLLNDLDD